MDGTPVSPVTLQVLNGLIDAQMKLRDAAEKRWSFAREALFNLARLVATDWLEEKQQLKGGLEVVRIEELNRVVFERVTALRSAYVHPEAEQLRNLLTRNEALRQEVEKFSLLASGYKGELEKTNLEVTRLKTQVENQKAKPVPQAQNSTTSSSAPTPQSASESTLDQVAPNVPLWFREWTLSTGFERQAFVIRLLGETGVSLRPEIFNSFTEKFKTEETSGAFNYVTTKLTEKGFITAADTAGGSIGRPAKTICLTNLGESVYALLSGKQPVKSEFEEIRSAHSSDAHTVLILKAGSLLETNGYEIISKNKIIINLPDGRITSPDILARKNGNEIRIEVERDTGKGDANARERKWQNAFDAGPDCLYVVCENSSFQKRLTQEIYHALASEERLARADLYLTNLEVLKTGQRHADGSVWVFQKHKKTGGV